MKAGLSSVMFTATLSLALVAGNARSETAGTDMNIHNKTGQEVAVFVFQEGGVHVDEAGGTQLAVLKNGESAVAHVPDCEFSILLADEDEVWHAEFDDCKSTDLTFNADTGHAMKAAATPEESDADDAGDADADGDDDDNDDNDANDGDDSDGN